MSLIISFTYLDLTWLASWPDEIGKRYASSTDIAFSLVFTVTLSAGVVASAGFCRRNLYPTGCLGSFLDNWGNGTFVLRLSLFVCLSYMAILEAGGKRLHCSWHTPVVER